MAYKGVLVQNAVQALNIDSLNRNVKASVDVENGSVLKMNGLSAVSGEGEVWAVVAPTTGNLSNLWMACEPEVVVTVTGTKKYKGINPDVRDFYNPSGEIFSAFELKVGDIVTLSEDAIAGTISSNTYVVATNTALKLTWAATAISGVSLKLLETTYFSIADGSIGTQRTTAYRFVVETVA